MSLIFDGWMPTRERNVLYMTQKKNHWMRAAVCASLIIMVMIVFTIGVSAETDSSGQWTYRVENGGSVITGYVQEPEGDVILPDELDGHSVICIGDEAFQWAYMMTSVVIPDGVISIGAQAFEGNINLTITIPPSVTSIGEDAFSGGSYVLLYEKDSYAEQYVAENDVPLLYTDESGLWVYMLQDDKAAVMRYVGEMPVDDDGNPVGLEIPGELDGYSVVEIGESIFRNSNELTGISIPQGVRIINFQAFAYCYNLTSATIPEGVEYIGSNAFEGSGLTEITIPGNVETIGDGAFSWCENLTDVTLSEGIVRIGQGAFSVCPGLANIVIPDSVQSIGARAFEDSGEVVLVVSEGSQAERFAKDSGVAYTLAGSDTGAVVQSTAVDAEGWRCVHFEDGLMIVGYVEPPTGDLILPSELEGLPVRGIGKGALSDCWELTSVTIPETVTTIRSGVFDDCYSLTDVTIPASVALIHYDAFQTDGVLETIVLHVQEGSSAEYYARRYGMPFAVDGVDISVPISTEEWKGVLVDGSVMLTYYIPFEVGGELVIPDTVDGYPVVGIGDGALRSYLDITSVTIPVSVEHMDSSLFHWWEEIVLNVAEGSYAEQYAKELGITYAIEDADGNRRTLSSLVQEGDWQGVLLDDGVRILACLAEPNGELTVPDTLEDHPVTNLGAYSLAWNDDLTGITIPEGVNSIGDGTFSECVALTNVTLPDSLTSIGYEAFWSCGNLASLTIPTDVAYIGELAFEGCDELVLHVAKDSYAEQYATDNGITYEYVH